MVVVARRTAAAAGGVRPRVAVLPRAGSVQVAHPRRGIHDAFNEWAATAMVSRRAVTIWTLGAVRFKRPATPCPRLRLVRR